MILGMKRSWGEVWFGSQLQMVAASVGVTIAISVCSSPRSSRRFLRWSPRVLNSRGYVAGSGLRPISRIWQLGNAALGL